MFQPFSASVNANHETENIAIYQNNATYRKSRHLFRRYDTIRYISIENDQGLSQEFAKGDKRGGLVWSPSGVQGRAPVGSAAKPPEAGDTC